MQIRLPDAPRRPSRIAVFGAFGHGNVGDDLLAILLERLLAPIGMYTTERRQLPGFTIGDIDDLHRDAEKIDLLVIGGGGLLYNRYIAKLRLSRFPKPYGFLSVGIPKADWLEGLDDVVAAAEFVTLRDAIAINLFRDRFPMVPCSFMPDPALTLPRQQISRSPRQRPMILLNIRWIPPGWLRSEDPDDAVERQIDEFNRLIRSYASHADISAIGFAPQDDEILSRLDCEHRILGVHEAIHAIAQADALIATRLHAGIIAATQGTPFALVDYQDKVKGLAWLLGIQDRLFPFDNLGGLAAFIEQVLASNPSATPRIEHLSRRVGTFLRRLTRHPIAVPSTSRAATL